MGEKFDNLAEMKIDQIKKFLSKYAYKETKKEEKVLELHHLTKKKAQNANTGICGRKTSNICLIIFVRSQADTAKFLPLVDQFKNDPVTLTYVLAQDEPQMMSQFEIKGSGAIVYKPKRSKFTKIDSVEVEDVRNLVDSAISGGASSWTKISNKNNDGLLFNESKAKDEL